MREGPKNGRWKGGGAILKCERCTNDFEVEFGRKNVARFCSLPCFNKWKSEQYHLGSLQIKGRPSPHKGKRRIKWDVLNCKHCGEIFEKRPSTQRFFCGHPCQFAWRKRRMSADGNPNWKGGQSRLPYPFDWAEISRLVRKRDGNVCLSPICRGEDSRIVVHHIDFDKFNVTGTNLVSVCSQCNSRANFSREMWQALFAGIQAVRETAY